MALITNPLVNSYKRLVPGYGAPTELTWTENNQNSLVRIPVGRGEETRIELRSPDSAANPYLVLAVCLAAGLDGIKNKIAPVKSANCGAENLPAENLPETLKEAIDLFEGSSWIRRSWEKISAVNTHRRRKRMAEIHQAGNGLGG